MRIASIAIEVQHDSLNSNVQLNFLILLLLIMDKIFRFAARTLIVLIFIGAGVNKIQDPNNAWLVGTAQNGIKFGLEQSKKYGITLPQIINENVKILLDRTPDLLYAIGIAMVVSSGLVILGFRYAALILLVLIESFIVMVHLPPILEKGPSF